MKRLVVVFAIFVPLLGASTAADDGERLLTIDHYVRVKSIVPVMNGQTSQVYVRERVMAGVALRSASTFSYGGGAPPSSLGASAPRNGSGLSDRVVLFVHGAGTPAEVAFDVPYQDYSWMAFLARAGFDVFSMDTTGYGRSTRPAPMSDPCNLAKDRQGGFVSAPCAPSYPHALTTIASDWNDIDGAVDYIRSLRHVERVSLVGWSLGGPRAGGYASQHPEKVSKLILLAPAYNRQANPAPPATLPADGVPMNTQSHAEFTAGWDRQVGCPDQYDPAASDVVWSQMLESDPVGATWGPGVRRAPQTTTWGWTPALAGKMQMPTLLFAGAHDKQVAPDRVRELYADLGAKDKVFVDLACSSHNAMWERNHLLMFRASLEWLTQGAVNGSKAGMLRIGYPGKTESQ